MRSGGWHSLRDRMKAKSNRGNSKGASGPFAAPDSSAHFQADLPELHDVSPERLNKILSDNCGRDVEEILRDTERDNFMDAGRAKEYGLIDEVLVREPVPV